MNSNLDDRTGGPPHLYHAGTHRLIAPQATLARVEPYFSEMGITRIANVTGLDRIGIPVVMVTRPNSRSLAVSQGKGVDLACAIASGVMESVESYHAERIRLPVELGSFKKMTKRYPRVSAETVARCGNSRFTDDYELLWIYGENLLNGEEVWIPYESVHTNYTIPPPVGTGCFAATSNGLASGNHLLEAIAHGISEVIERDAVTLLSVQPEGVRLGKRLDLSTVSDSSCIEIIEKFRTAGLYVNVWNATSDVGVAVFLCRVTGTIDSVSNELKTAAGSGCHPSRKFALLRALTEAAQSRLTHITGSRDDMSLSSYTSGIDAKPMQIKFRIPDESQLVRYEDVPTHDSPALENDIAWLLQRVESIGLHEVICIDLTLKEFSIPVVRIVIPGLECAHDNIDYVPGDRARAILAPVT